MTAITFDTHAFDAAHMRDQNNFLAEKEHFQENRGIVNHDRREEAH